MNVKGVSHKVSDGNVIGQWKEILVIKGQETWPNCWVKRRNCNLDIQLKSFLSKV